MQSRPDLVPGPIIIHAFLPLTIVFKRDHSCYRLKSFAVFGATFVSAPDPSLPRRCLSMLLSINRFLIELEQLLEMTVELQSPLNSKVQTHVYARDDSLLRLNSLLY